MRQPYYRLVYGESDGLPGLVVDRYGSACVVQIGTAGMERLEAADSASALEQVVCAARRCCSRTTARRASMEGLPAMSRPRRAGSTNSGVVVEDGLEFQVPLAEGQKTGWFFDQAANRRALTKYVREGARVLDVFSYVGAWGVRAARSGAREVLCVDSSAAALGIGREQRAQRRAQPRQAHRRQGRCLRCAGGFGREARAHSIIVIIDPPAFAKRKKDLPKALAAYKRLNQLAMQLLAHDGILVSCSCSYHVSAGGIAGCDRQGGARSADRHLQMLEVGGQAPDHPVHPAIPETRYLKAYFCRVNDTV